jgi:hypothetical protein
VSSRIGLTGAAVSVHFSRRNIDLSYVRSSIRVALLSAIALAAGCQSGVERDVVQREMRQQEDQIYALEDYLSEYQQLLCDARSENEQLKQQMVKGQFRDDNSSGKANGGSARPSRPATSPSTPPGVREPEVAPRIAPPVVPPLDLSEPVVPPLKDQSAHEPEQHAREIQPAAAEIEVVGEVATAVVLRGEVELDDQTDGPRVLAEVEPVDDAGQLVNFRGRLSLMVLDPVAIEREQQLARWDFEPKDLGQLAKRAKHGTSFEFPLQLPAEVPKDRPLELWVRLLPEDGEKVLGRTTLDLSRAGRFASVEVKPATKKTGSSPVRVATAESDVKPERPATHHRIDTDVRQSGWQTARPGELAKPQAAAATASAEWKLATRPIPEAESRPVVESMPVRSFLPPSTTNDRYGDAEAPDWSPERPDGGATTSPQTPAWSPTR